MTDNVQEDQEQRDCNFNLSKECAQDRQRRRACVQPHCQKSDD